jgi:serine/threonine protein kinase
MFIWNNARLIICTELSVHINAFIPTAFSNQPILFKTLCGTLAYIAPEVIGRLPFGAVKVDLWAYGVILFVLSSGYLPFNDVNLRMLYSKLTRQSIVF